MRYAVLKRILSGKMASQRKLKSTWTTCLMLYVYRTSKMIVFVVPNRTAHHVLKNENPFDVRFSSFIHTDNNPRQSTHFSRTLCYYSNLQFFLQNENPMRSMLDAFVRFIVRVHVASYLRIMQITSGRRRSTVSNIYLFTDGFNENNGVKLSRWRENFEHFRFKYV